MEPWRDAATGEQCILMRRLRVLRFNLPPNSTLLHREIQYTLPFVNGDLHMAVLCKKLQEICSVRAALPTTCPRRTDSDSSLSSSDWHSGP